MLACPASEDNRTPSAPPSASSAAQTGAVQRIEVRASEKGFEPAEIHFTRGALAVIAITRTSDSACVRAVKMPWRAEPYPLPVGETVSIEIPDTSQTGTFVYACWMDMLFGRVFIDAP
jgi:plastocyanin domain-containing protein